MARRFRMHYLLAAFFACAILSQGQSASSPKTSPANADSTAPITFGQAVVPLNGPWRFQIGDSPINPQTGTTLWADPEFDDSHWETIELKPQAGVAEPVQP